MGRRVHGDSSLESQVELTDECSSKQIAIMPYEALVEHLEHHKQYNYDPRFRSYNRSRECAWNYGEYFRCMRVLGDRCDDTAPCGYFKNQYEFICANKEKEAWDDMREQGLFWGKIY